ncbi:DUF992 domain-containing protein [Antarcticirhabdus aurantiaca]|uniref:DUF992 domain-containing protein n=1 Tax=Antarcticirhabdus aurantiaca TaxID=2606717 RepID=A0ACD4NU58_9HYPH|nr:DUF992 domain-containing protein [Antarcticirhabdus aurantiaca]WAJ30268.1 DUF992 domain-containing protein [Jeongeuplla avenae]
MKKIALALAALGAATVASVPAHSTVAIEIGTLTCSGTSEGSTNYIVASSRALACSYVPAGRTSGIPYAGQIDTLGLDLGITQRTTLTWAVFAASGVPVRPEVLAGTYVGAGADAALGIGGGAKVLVGGFGSSIALQPISVQAQYGLNATAGINRLTLQMN